MPFRKEVMSVRSEWSVGSRGHSDHPGQKVPRGCPRDHFKEVGGWAPRAPRHTP